MPILDDVPIFQYHLEHITEEHSARAMAHLAHSLVGHNNPQAEALAARLTEVLAEGSSVELDPRVRTVLEGAKFNLVASKGHTSLLERRVLHASTTASGLLNLSLRQRITDNSAYDARAFIEALTPECLRTLINNESITGIDLSLVPLTAEHLAVLTEHPRPHIRTLILAGSLDDGVLKENTAFAHFIRLLHAKSSDDPEKPGSLPNLEHLDLSENDLLGSLTQTHVTQDAHMLRDIQITEWSTRSNLFFHAIQSHGSNLKTLKLHQSFNNDKAYLPDFILTGLSSTLLECPNLETLDLSGNSIGRLQSADESTLFLSYFFADIGKLQHLKTLDLASNRLSYALRPNPPAYVRSPRDYGSVVRMQGDNPHEAFCSMLIALGSQSLERLDLRDNHLDQLPDLNNQIPGALLAYQNQRDGTHTLSR